MTNFVNNHVDLDGLIGIDGINIRNKIILDGIANPNANPIKTALVDNVCTNLVKTLKRDESGMPQLIIRETLSQDQMTRLQSAYPSFSIKWTSEINNGHGFAAASRKCEYLQCLMKFKYDRNVDYVDKLKGEYDCYVCDIGGDVGKHFVEKNKCIISLNPVCDARDMARYSTKINLIYNYALHNELDEWQQEIMKGMVNGGECKTFSRREFFQNTSVKALYGIMIHSNYDVTLRQLADGMNRSGMQEIYGSFIYSPEINYAKSGYISGIDCYFEYSNKGKKLRFSFKDDSSWEYEHDVRTYMSYLISTVFTDSKRKNYFFLELLENKNGIQFFKVIRNKYITIINKPINHKIWYDAMRPLTKVTFFTVDYDELAKGKDSRWTWIMGRQKQNYLSGIFKEKTFFVDTEIMEKGKECAYGNTESKFKPTEIYNFLRSYAQRIFFGKEVLYRGKNIPADELFELANAIYLYVYVKKHDVGKVTQHIINEITFDRELATGGILKKIFMRKKRIFNSDITPYPLINNIHGWLYRIRKSDLNITTQLLQDTIKFENFGESENVIYEMYNKIINTNKGGAVEYFDNIVLPKFIRDNCIMNVKDIVKRVIKDNLGIEIVMDKVEKLDKKVNLLNEYIAEYTSNMSNDVGNDYFDLSSKTGTISEVDCAMEIHPLTNLSMLSDKIYNYDDEKYNEILCEYNTLMDKIFLNRSEAKLREMFNDDRNDWVESLRGAEILDLGAGPGGFTRVLKDYGNVTCHVFGNSEKQCKLVEKDVKMLNITHGDLTDLDEIKYIIENNKRRYDFISADAHIHGDNLKENNKLITGEVLVIKALLKEKGGCLIKFIHGTDFECVNTVKELINMTMLNFSNMRFIMCNNTNFLSTEFYVYFSNYSFVEKVKDLNLDKVFDKFINILIKRYQLFLDALIKKYGVSKYDICRDALIRFSDVNDRRKHYISLGYNADELLSKEPIWMRHELDDENYKEKVDNWLNSNRSESEESVVTVIENDKSNESVNDIKGECEKVDDENVISDDVKVEREKVNVEENETDFGKEDTENHNDEGESENFEKETDLPLYENDCENDVFEDMADVFDNVFQASDLPKIVEIETKETFPEKSTVRVKENDEKPTTRGRDDEDIIIEKIVENIPEKKVINENVNEKDKENTIEIGTELCKYTEHYVFKPVNNKIFTRTGYDAACCFFSILATDNINKMKRLKKLLLDAFYENKIVPIITSDFVGPLTSSSMGGLEHVIFSAVILGVDYIYPCQSMKATSHFGYRTIVLKYGGMHYDNIPYDCPHILSLEEVDYEFKGAVWLKSLLNLLNMKYEDYISCFDNCNNCVINKLSNIKNKQNIMMMFPNKEFIEKENFMQYVNKNNFDLYLGKVRGYYFVVLKKKKEENSKKIIQKSPEKLLKMIDWHNNVCHTCSGGNIDRIININESLHHLSFCRYNLTNTVGAEVDVIDMHIYYVSKFAGIGAQLADIDHNKIDLVIKNENVYGSLYALCEKLFINRREYKNKTVAINANREWSLDIVYACGTYFKSFVDTNSTILNKDNLLMTFNPVFVTIKTAAHYKYNAMNEQRELWGYAVKSIMENISSTFAEWKTYYTNEMHKEYVCTKADFGVIDFEEAQWLVKPKIVRNSGYEYGWNGTDFVKIKSFFLGSKIMKNMQCGTVAISNECVMFSQTSMYKVVEKYELTPDSYNPTVNMFIGVPGCGKTSTIIKSHDVNDPKHIIVTTTRDSMMDIRNRIKNKYSTLPASIDLKKKYRTLDSCVMAGVMDDVDVLWVDEGLMSHYGQILWVGFLGRAKVINIYGDPAQIPYILRDQTLTIYYQSPLENAIIQSPSTTSHRCPVDVMALINTMGIYQFKAKSTNTCMKSMKAFITSDIDSNYFGKSHILTFTQSEKIEIMQKYSIKNVSTIHEYQGQQTEHIMLIRSVDKHNTIYSSNSHILVALTRHTKSLRYYTVVPDRTYELINTEFSNDQLDDARLSLKGGGVVKGTLNDVPAHPMYEVIPAKSYAYLDTERKIRDILIQHMVPAMIPMTITVHNYNNIKDNIDPFIPQIEINNSIFVLQDFFDKVFPGESVVDNSYDSMIFERDPFTIYATDFRISRTTYVNVERQELMIPKIRTNCPTITPNTQNQVIKAYSERNGLVPKLHGDRNYDRLIDLMVKKFVDTYVKDKQLFASYAKEILNPNVNDIFNWLSSQNPRVYKEIIADENYNVFDKEVSIYKIIMKRMAKPCLDKGGINKYSSPQTIAYVDKMINMLYCPIVREIKKRITAVLKENYVIYSDMSLNAFEKLLNGRLPPKHLRDYRFLLEIDFSKYDKSQDYLILLFECKFLSLLGVPMWLVNLWMEMHAYTQLWDPKNKFKAFVCYQRKSGDAMTFLGNTIILMCVLACVYDLSEVFAIFSGDDSIIFSKIVMQMLNQYLKLGYMFNMEAKLLKYDEPYFCSKFLIPVSDVTWIVVPDIVKTVIKIGRKDLVDLVHVEEYRVSLYDNLRQLQNAFYNTKISNAINARYGITGDHTCVLGALNTILQDKETFAKMYDVGMDVGKKVYNMRPNLDI